MLMRLNFVISESRMAIYMIHCQQFSKTYKKQETITNSMFKTLIKR